MAVTEKTTPSPSGSPHGPAERRILAGGVLELGKRFLALREGAIVVVTIVAFLYFASGTNNFTSSGNLQNLLPYFAPIAIVAFGEVWVMILGEIDLSVGAIYLFTPFMWHILHHAGIPLYPSLILALVIAMGIGAINALFITFVGMSSFVATLGMLFSLDGLTLIVSHATQIATPGTKTIGLNTFSQIFGRGTYSELFWAVGIAIVLQIALTFTRWGLYTVSVGGNRLGAAEAGIRTNRIIMRNFMLSALLAGFVGVLETVRTTSATPDPSGANAELLLFIAAAIIGGTLMTGGDGTVIGALIGALFIGILQDGLILKGVSANYTLFYLGIAVIIAMSLYVVVRRIRLGSGRG
jgi:simple sugar transport system permease protein